MATLRRTGTVLVTLALAAQVALAEAPQDDAGTGGDASDLRATATPLPGPGAYAGELRSRDDDWYATAADGAPRCVTMEAGGDTNGSATLALQTPSGVRGVKAQLPASGTVRLAVAGDATQAWYGIERDPNPAAHDPARPRGYAFEARDAATWASGDAGTSQDAGSLLSGALPADGPCTTGHLRPLNGLGDATDVFTVPVTAGTQVVVSLASTMPVTLRVAAPDGTPLAEVASDGIASFVAPSDGTYTMTASSVTGAGVIDYVIGLMGPEPPGGPCRPYCVLVTG